jgi:hypothetical protein
VAAEFPQGRTMPRSRYWATDDSDEDGVTGRKVFDDVFCVGRQGQVRCGRVKVLQGPSARDCENAGLRRPLLDDSNPKE